MPLSQSCSASPIPPFSANQGNVLQLEAELFYSCSYTMSFCQNGSSWKLSSSQALRLFQAAEQRTTMVSCPPLFFQDTFISSLALVTCSHPKDWQGVQRATGSVGRQEEKAKFQLATSRDHCCPFLSHRSLHFQQHKFALPSSLGRGSSYLRNDLRPVLKKASICSRDLPLVSGTQHPVNKTFPALMTAKKRKGTSRPKAFWKVGQKRAVSWCREVLRRGCWTALGSTHHDWEEELGQGEGCQPAHDHTEARGHPTGFEREDLRHQQPSDGAPAHGITCRGGGEGGQV